MFHYLYSDRAYFCCPLWTLIIKVMTTINFCPEGKYFSQCCAASATFTVTGGTAYILDKVSHRGYVLSSMVFSESSVIGIMSIKKILNSSRIKYQQYRRLPCPLLTVSHDTLMSIKFRAGLVVPFITNSKKEVQGKLLF